MFCIMSVDMENIIHLAYVLYLFSYLVRDILWLRILTIQRSSSTQLYAASKERRHFSRLAHKLIKTGLPNNSVVEWLDPDSSV